MIAFFAIVRGVVPELVLSPVGTTPSARCRSQPPLL